MITLLVSLALIFILTSGFYLALANIIKSDDTNVQFTIGQYSVNDIKSLASHILTASEKITAGNEV